MTRSLWRQISHLYQAARDWEPGQRAALLDEACAGDEAVRREVKSLLDEDDGPAGFLGRPVMALLRESLAGKPPPSLEGRRLGPYEIGKLLGAGGMGEVYRARDTRLQRDVALKVLSHSADAGAERHHRFTREALAAGALNHPHIVAVHDVGVEDGIPYLVSELIVGESLRQEMERGRPALKRLLGLGAQIADGLAAAHDAGIVHRDLKPENVMITPEGRAKIVDFGLAKAPLPANGGADVAGKERLTAAGVLIGTVPYMSPEQARGGSVDFRSDQFSLGIILYELATSAHPFQRDSPVQTLAAVIDAEPPDLTAVSPPIPPPLRWLMARLLAKNPADRYAHTGDVAADLKTIRDHVTELAPSLASASADVRQRRAPWMVAAIAIGSLGVGVLAVPQPSAPRYRYTPVATDAGYQGTPAWSPDGTMIAYVAEVDGVLQVFTKRVGSATRTQVTRSAFDCRDPFWSPDGQSIYYHRLARHRESLWRVSATGEPSTLLIEGARRGAISPDGRVLAVVIEDAEKDLSHTLWWSSPPEVPPTQYTRLPLATFVDATLAFSPDSRTLLLWAMANTQAPGTMALEVPWLIDLASGEPKRVLSALTGARTPSPFSWMPDSRRVVFVHSEASLLGSHLWMADVPMGDIHPITSTYVNEGFPAVAPDGNRIAFTSESTDFDLIAVSDDGTQPEVLLSSTRNELDPAWSPVAPQYAFVTDRSGTQEIWLRSEAGDWERPLVTDADFTDGPTLAFGSLEFSPDGQRLAYQRFSKTGYRLWMSTLGGGRAVPITATSGEYQNAPTWSPDGEWIAFVAGEALQPNETARAHDLVKVRLGANAGKVALLRDVFKFSRPVWSLDGRWILAQTRDGLMRVTPDGERQEIVSNGFWLTFAWEPDATRVYGLQASDDQKHLMLVVLDVPGGHERIVNANLGVIPNASQPIRGFTRAGRRGFATSIARVRSDIWMLEDFLPAPPLWQRLWSRQGAP